MELDVITAVVLGGTSVFGGRGGLGGTLLGVLLLHEVRQFISWRWNNDELILVVVGGLLIGSVLLNQLLSRERGQHVPA
jgi:rhamnose transport system permease protein